MTTAERNKPAEAIGEYANDPLGFVMYAFPWGEAGPLERESGPGCQSATPRYLMVGGLLWNLT
jgi:hypothetical protein